MKKSILIFAAVLFMSLTAAYAQEQDTTQASPSTEYTKDMVKITSSELPQPVQESLKGSMYKGWETGEIYRNQTSDQFTIRYNDGTTPKVYHFDAQGKPITKENK